MFVPVINSMEGLSLTPKQWNNLDIQVFCYDVLGLLQRPGYPKIFDIKKDLVGQGKVILDTRALNIVQGKIQYRTPDGSLKKITLEELADWLPQLNADGIIWALPQVIQEMNCVCANDFDVSNLTAQDGFLGYCYQDNHKINLLDKEYEQNYDLLTADCACESCEQGVTLSYLHHLIQHTPLLAQRYLVIHNIWQYQKISQDLK